VFFAVALVVALVILPGDAITLFLVRARGLRRARRGYAEGADHYRICAGAKSGGECVGAGSEAYRADANGGVGRAILVFGVDGGLAAETRASGYSRAGNHGQKRGFLVDFFRAGNRAALVFAIVGAGHCRERERGADGRHCDTPGDGTEMRIGG